MFVTISQNDQRCHLFICGCMYLLVVPFLVIFYEGDSTKTGLVLWNTVDLTSSVCTYYVIIVHVLQRINSNKNAQDSCTNSNLLRYISLKLSLVFFF